MPPARLARDYFPLAQGAVRKYSSSDVQGKGAFTVEILSVAAADGVTTAHVRKTVHSEPPRVVEYEVAKNAAGVRSDGFTEFKLPIELGAKWIVSPRRYWIEALDAVVETPAGKFKECMRVAYLIAEGDGGSGERYYAPGVGLVKVVENDEGEPFTHELTAYSL